MDKLISQQAAIDMLKELTANGTNKGMVFGEDAVHRIEILPSVHPEIIRCKDCVYQTESWSGIKYCEAHGDHIGKDYDYCSNARRKENGH